MKKALGRKFWIAMVLFSLMGQVAWVVENMYFNVFIYKMFHASAANISTMVAASAIAATLTTWLMGALSDKVGKRKIFICGGYIIWGISILSFALIRVDVLTPIAGSAVQAASLGVTLVIIMDCVMTFFGSTANDACFNAWLTDCGDESNRGKIEGINSMMPLMAILVVFGSFMAFNLEEAASWTKIYLIIGIAVILIGILGFFLLQDSGVKTEETSHYWKNVLYSFKVSTIKENKLLYAVIGAFSVFGISIQIFMPYLIIYYEKTLGMANYVLIMAPAIIMAAVITAFYGKIYDMMGFKSAVIPTVIMLMAGYVFLYFCTGTVLVFIGSLLMMSGYLTGMAMFGAMIRDLIPENKAGMFQGLRIVGQVLIPGIIGPMIGAAVLKNAQQIINGDGTVSFLPNRNIYMAAFIAAVFLLVVLNLIFYMMSHGHNVLRVSKEGEEGWDEYPRPQLVRDSFFSLNGEWTLNNQTIKVPFAPQSVLSGFQGKVGGKLHYQKIFTLPAEFHVEKDILHFESVDEVAVVTLNGTQIGKNEGGYLPFEMDVSSALKEGENILEVCVTDTLSGKYPFGKQKKKRGGMWYTPISGIWKSVWLESVHEVYIKNIELHTTLDTLFIKAETATEKIRVEINADGEWIGFEGNPEGMQIDLHNIKLANGSMHTPHIWNTKTPYLYPIRITADQDVVESYFGIREVTIQEIKGSKRICLNGAPVFLHGVLDQGYYSDGIYLPATESEYEKDILRMKELGFNTLRKHIKIEPDCFYQYCDKHGMLVIQDMVNNGRYSFVKDTAAPTIGLTKRQDKVKHYNARQRFFVQYMEKTMHQLYNHPSVIGYTIFNEGWGQFDSDNVYELAKKVDCTRVIDATSGWFWQEKSDVDSYHIYFKTAQVPKTDRPSIISECGGFSYLVPEHVYSKYTHFGYGGCESKEAVTKQMVEMYETMVLPAIKNGLCGCIYTQLSDVEDETNGLFTYDRKECKIVKEDILKLSKELSQEINQ